MPWFWITRTKSRTSRPCKSAPSTLPSHSRAAANHSGNNSTTSKARHLLDRRGGPGGHLTGLPGQAENPADAAPGSLGPGNGRLLGPGGLVPRSGLHAIRRGVAAGLTAKRLVLTRQDMDQALLTLRTKRVPEPLVALGANVLRAGQEGDDDVYAHRSANQSHLVSHPLHECLCLS